MTKKQKNYRQLKLIKVYTCNKFSHTFDNILTVICVVLYLQPPVFWLLDFNIIKVHGQSKSKRIMWLMIQEWCTI